MVVLFGEVVMGGCFVINLLLLLNVGFLFCLFNLF